MKDLLNKKQNTNDYPVRITFDIICDSDTSMQEGDSIKERILGYVNQCTDAIDESMCHWGDHTHCIDPVKVELYDEDENLIDVTDDILEEINPDAIQCKINDKLKQLKKYIVELNKQYKELMECPEELPSRKKISEGKYLHTDEPHYGDPTYWIYPEGVEEKIEDDKKYRVWYISRDAADPADSTTWNYVKYIQYIPTEKYELKKELENLINILTFGK